MRGIVKVLKGPIHWDNVGRALACLLILAGLWIGQWLALTQLTSIRPSWAGSYAPL